MATDDYLSIGKISGAHGVNGNLKIHPHGDDLSAFDTGIRLFIRGVSGRQCREISVTEWRPHGRVFLLSCKEITSRSQAEKEIGGDLVILRSDLPEPERDTYYWVDLIGLSVYTVEDAWVGRIKSILPTGSNDVYVVFDEKTGKETLVPGIKTMVKEINLADGVMRVDLTDMPD